MSTRRLLAALVVALTACTTPADTGPEQRVESFVWQGRVFAETEFPFVEYPLASTPVTLVEGEISLLQARTTEIYFWPLANATRIDRTRLDEPLDGTLEVRRGDVTIVEVAQEPFVLQQEGDDDVVLEVGPNAEQAYAIFLAERDAHLAAAARYEEELAAYRRELTRLAEEARELDRPLPEDELPEEPVAPEAFLMRSTPLSIGFPVLLSAGEYQLRLLDEQAGAVPGSERSLRILERRDPEVAFRIVPEDRWTDPDVSLPDDPIVTAARDSVLYLEPELRRAYDGRGWAQLTDPQSAARTAPRTTWVPTTETVDEQAPLVVSDRQIEREAYQVVQQPGRTLGYRIEPWEGARTPDLDAYRIDLSEVSGPAHLELNGHPESARTLQVVAPVAPLPIGIALGLVPVGWWVVRRRGRARAEAADA